jgi:hypothetical protein
MGYPTTSNASEAVHGQLNREGRHIWDFFIRLGMVIAHLTHRYLSRSE